MKEFEISTEQLLGIRKIKRVKSEEEVTLKMIEDGYKTAAYIVKKYGDKYLPIFVRMHEELEKKKSLLKHKEKALSLFEENEW